MVNPTLQQKDLSAPQSLQHPTGTQHCFEVQNNRPDIRKEFSISITKNNSVICEQQMGDCHNSSRITPNSKTRKTTTLYDLVHTLFMISITRINNHGERSSPCLGDNFLY